MSAADDADRVGRRPPRWLYALTATVMLGAGFGAGRWVAAWRARPGPSPTGAEAQATIAALMAAAGVEGGGSGTTVVDVPPAAPDSGGLSVGLVEPGMASLGEPAPPFSLAGPAAGSTVSLADHAGKGILLNFWATWCVPCRVEMPFLQALHDQHAASGELAVVAIDVDEPAEVVAPYLAELGLTFPVGLDVDGRVADQYRIGTYPTTYLIGRDGRVMSIKRGAYSSSFELDQAASLLLGAP